MDGADRPITANLGFFVDYESYKTQMLRVMNDLVVRAHLK